MGQIQAVAFDCFGTLIDFDDVAFGRAYAQCALEQGMEIDGKVLYDKWMEIWRRIARQERVAQGEVDITPAAAAVYSSGGEPSRPGPPSEPEYADNGAAQRLLPRSASARVTNLDGPAPPFRPYGEEWPEHFELVFEELGFKGDGKRAYRRLVEIMGVAPAFQEARHVVEALAQRFPIACMSNSDDDFLHPPLAHNGLVFPVVISSEAAQAYKPHIAIFKTLSDAMGLSPENILYVGDNRGADVAGAKHAGMQAAWVHRPEARARQREREREGDGNNQPPFRNDPRMNVDPDYEIETLDLLLDILDIR